MNFVAESLCGWQNGPFEMPHLAFVVIAHVNDNGVVLIGEGVEFFGRNVLATIGNVKGVVVQSVGNNFVSDFDDQF